LHLTSNFERSKELGVQLYCNGAPWEDEMTVNTEHCINGNMSSNSLSSAVINGRRSRWVLSVWDTFEATSHLQKAALLVQCGVRYVDLGFHRIFQTESSNLLVMT
jgi:hypothetical protein